VTFLNWCALHFWLGVASKHLETTAIDNVDNFLLLLSFFIRKELVLSCLIYEYIKDKVISDETKKEPLAFFIHQCRVTCNHISEMHTSFIESAEGTV